MSYLSDLLHRRVSAKDTLAKSVTYLKVKLGITVSDDVVDHAVKATDEFTDAVDALAKAYIATHLPLLPAQVVATAAVTSLLQTIDTAIAGAANVVKANN